MKASDAQATVINLNPHLDPGTVSIEVPELENPVLMGRAIAIVYQDESGAEWAHEFDKGAQLLVDDGIAVVVDDRLSVDDLGMEED